MSKYRHRIASSFLVAVALALASATLALHTPSAVRSIVEFLLGLPWPITAAALLLPFAYALWAFQPDHSFERQMTAAREEIGRAKEEAHAFTARLAHLRQDLEGAQSAYDGIKAKFESLFQALEPELARKAEEQRSEYAANVNRMRGEVLAALRIDIKDVLRTHFVEISRESAEADQQRRAEMDKIMQLTSMEISDLHKLVSQIRAELNDLRSRQR
jgi:DNA anti-recombination protein RmuC